MNQVSTPSWVGKQSVAHLGYPIILTQRQRDVLLLLCEGLPNKLISRRLAISDATVKTHVASVLRSLNTSTRLEAVILAFRLNLVRTIQSEPGPSIHDEVGRRYAERPPLCAVAA